MKPTTTNTTTNTMPEPELNIANIDAIARLVSANQSNKGGVVPFADKMHALHPYVIVPEGYRVEYLAHAPAPPLLTYISAAPSFNDAASFSRYVKAFAGNHSLIFLDEFGVFRAVIDYHGKDSVDRVRHVASFKLQHSEAWNFWAKLNDKWLTQEGIVEVFMTRRGDITDPTDSDLVRFASDFSANESIEHVQVFDRASGKSKMVVKAEANTAGADAKPVIPELTLAIPVWRNGDNGTVNALLAWKGKPDRFVKITLIELEAAREAAILLQSEIVSKQTGIAVLLGSPEL